jgi:hypothetical protein
MTKNSDDKRAQAQAHLTQMGAGLGSIFEAVTQLLSKAGDGAGEPVQRDGSFDLGGGKGLKGNYSLRMGTLDGLAARSGAKPAAPAARARSAAPVIPQKIECFEDANGVMLVIDCSEIPADDIIATVSASATSICVTGFGTDEIIRTSQFVTRTCTRTVRNGYLSLRFDWDMTAPTDADKQGTA